MIINSLYKQVLPTPQRPPSSEKYQQQSPDKGSDKPGISMLKPLIHATQLSFIQQCIVHPLLIKKIIQQSSTPDKKLSFALVKSTFPNSLKNRWICNSSLLVSKSLTEQLSAKSNFFHTLAVTMLPPLMSSALMLKTEIIQIQKSLTTLSPSLGKKRQFFLFLYLRESVYYQGFNGTAPFIIEHSQSLSNNPSLQTALKLGATIGVSALCSLISTPPDRLLVTTLSNNQIEWSANYLFKGSFYRIATITTALSIANVANWYRTESK